VRNKMTISLGKTKEMIFRRPCPIRYRYHFVPSIDGVAWLVKTPGVILQQGSSFDVHVTELFKQCSQRVYLTNRHADCCVVRDCLLNIWILFLLFWLYFVWCMRCPPVVCLYLLVVRLHGRIDSFLKRAHKWGFCKDRVTLNELVNTSGL